MCQVAEEDLVILCLHLSEVKLYTFFKSFDNILSKPAFSSILMGYHIMGWFPIGSSALGMLLDKSVILDPRPAAIITAWNSILIVGTQQPNPKEIENKSMTRRRRENWHKKKKVEFIQHRYKTNNYKPWFWLSFHDIRTTQAV